MIKAIEHNCTRWYTWTIPPVETGVKQRADVVCLPESPRERGGVGICDSAYEIRKRKRVWTAVHKGSGLATDERTYVSRGAKDDVIVTDVKRTGEKTTRIINVYDQRAMQMGHIPARTLNWQTVIRQGGTVLAGHFNAHSQRWDPQCTQQKDATYWEEIIDEYGHEIGNDDRPTHHWVRDGNEGESIIDLTLAHRPITKWTILNRSHATDSDDEIIEWEVNVDKQEDAEDVRIVGWNLSTMSKEDEEAAVKLWTELDTGRAQLADK